MGPNQDELLARAVEGDADALGKLLEIHGPPIRRSIAGRIPRRWQALLSEDDVMQQTYADAFRSMAQFESFGDDSFTAWLTRLAQCNLHDAVKMLEREKRGGARRRIEAVGDDGSYAALYELVSATSSTPSRRAARAEARQTLEHAIAQLPEVYRQVVQMYDLAGQDVQAVAAALDRSPGAVYMLRARAHRRLGELLSSATDFLSGSP
jgi:RNA polymerase sigma-70 factor (ECF subfamily)